MMTAEDDLSDRPKSPPLSKNDPDNDNAFMQEDYLILPSRVRVFHLESETGNWLGVATGACQMQILGDTLFVTVDGRDLIEEEDAEASADGPSMEEQRPYATEITPDMNLILQQETVVSWIDAQGREVAFSFETEDGVRVFWVHACYFLGIPEDVAISCQEGARTETLRPAQPVSSTEIKLPEVLDNENAEEVAQTLRQLNTTSTFESAITRRRTVNFVLDHDYLARLPGLQNQRLARSLLVDLFLLNSPLVFRAVVSDAYFGNCVRILDPELTMPSFHPLYGLPEDSHSLVHVIQRLTLLRDTLLAPYLDDSLQTGLTMLIRSNQMTLLEMLDSRQLFKSIADSAPLDEKSLGFVRDLVSLWRSNPLKPLEGCEVLLRCLLSQLRGPCKLSSLLVIELIARSDLGRTRRWLIDDPVSLRLLLESVTVSDDWKMRTMLHHLIYFLCSPCSQLLQDKTLDDFLNVLYPTPASTLLTQLCDDRNDDEMSVLLLDLLNLFITQHRYRPKYLLLREHLSQPLSRLLKHASPFVKLKTIRLLRVMLCGDEFYTRIFIKCNITGALLEELMLRNTLSSDNPICSGDCIQASLLELFDTILASRSRQLVDCLVETHGTAIASLISSPDPTIKKLFTELQLLHHELHAKESTEIDIEQRRIKEDAYFEADETTKMEVEETEPITTPSKNDLAEDGDAVSGASDERHKSYAEVVLAGTEESPSGADASLFGLTPLTNRKPRPTLAINLKPVPSVP